MLLPVAMDESRLNAAIPCVEAIVREPLRGQFSAWGVPQLQHAAISTCKTMREKYLPKSGTRRRC